MANRRIVTPGSSLVESWSTVSISASARAARGTFPNAGPGQRKSAVAILTRVAYVVLDPGPILHADIERYDDDHIETGLELLGHDGRSAVYRLLELDATDITDAKGLPYHWKPRHIMERLQRGENPPPIVVAQSDSSDRPFVLIDGFNRTYAHWLAGSRIRAYELIVRGHSRTLAQTTALNAAVDNHAPQVA